MPLSVGRQQNPSPCYFPCTLIWGFLLQRMGTLQCLGKETGPCTGRRPVVPPSGDVPLGTGLPSVGHEATKLKMSFCNFFQSKRPPLCEDSGTVHGCGHLASSEVVMAERVCRGTGALLYGHSPCCPHPCTRCAHIACLGFPSRP